MSDQTLGWSDIMSDIMSDQVSEIMMHSEDFGTRRGCVALLLLRASHPAWLA